MIPRAVAAIVVIVIVASSPALAQDTSAHHRAPRRVLWTLVGAGGGFGIGLFVGLKRFDDAINSDRKVWTSAIIGAGAGAAIGWWLTRPRATPTRQSCERCLKMLPVNRSFAFAAFTGMLVAGSLQAPMTSAPSVSIERLDPRFDRLVPRDVKVEPIADGLDWVEGPVWRQRAGDLLFSNIPKNAVMRWHAKDGLSVFLQPSGYTGQAPFTGPEPGSNGLTVDADGNLVLCQHGDRRITRIAQDGSKTVLAERFEGKRFNSPNDLVFAPDGALYFTDPPYGLPKTFDDPAKELPFQGVYRRSPDGSLTLLTRDLRAPNGIGLSPDAKTLYVANSDRSNAVWMAFELLDSGTRLGPGRVFASAQKFVAERPGAPDGLKVDRAGNVFATGPGGVYVFAPDGTHLGSILFNQPTGNCAWGEDGSTLFITSNKSVYRARLATSGPLPGSTR